MDKRIQDRERPSICKCTQNKKKKSDHLFSNTEKKETFQFF